MIVKLGEHNELACEDLILSIHTDFSVEYVLCGLARNAKNLDFPQSNCIVAWDRLVHKYVHQSDLSLLKLKSEFHNFKLESAEKDSNEWIVNLEGPRN